MSKENGPLVSVIMPTLNCKEYLSQTIESVLSQTFQDFEFIIVDDNSTDGTREIVESYANKDSRVILVDGEKNGIGGALNKGCKLAKGKYIARIDADDICLPNRFEVEVKYLDNRQDVILVTSDYFIIAETDEVRGRCYPATSKRVVKKLLSLNLNPIAHPTVMFRKEVYDKTKGYPQTPSHEDLILWKSFSPFGEIGIIKEPLINHRMIGTTLSRKFMGNPYEKILDSMVGKIIHEEGQNSDDIEIYKKVMRLASNVAQPSEYETEVTKGESVNRIVGSVLPNTISEPFIYLIKNVYLYFRYSCWK